MLVSYSGRDRADVDFTKARKVQFKAWQKAANKAVKAKEEKPPKPDNLREDTLYLTPGSTAEVTPEELAVIREERKDVSRYVDAHRNAPKVPRSKRPKGETTEAKPEESGDGDGGGSGSQPATTKPVKPTKRTKPKGG